MWRMNNEDGATAVVVALMTLVLFGFGAIAVDAGQLYQERRELQNGADAAALAAAQDCADPDPLVSSACLVTPVADNCDLATALLEGRIDEYANFNANDGSSNACVYELDLTNQFITVETETLSGGNGFLTHWFAWALDHETTTVKAQATAAWGTAGAASTVPLTFSYCEWSDMILDADGDGVPDAGAFPTAAETIYFHTPSDTSDDCIGPAGQDAPGGFGWLDTDGSDSCEADVTSGQEVDGDTGNPTPTAIDSGCDDAFWQSLVGETILVPIFSSITGTGTNATYYIEGFAAFVLEGYRFTGANSYSYPTPAPCNPPDSCIRGHFVDYISYGDYINGGAANYGVTTITLIK